MMAESIYMDLRRFNPNDYYDWVHRGGSGDGHEGDMKGTIVAQREAGGITQHIGASLFPYDAVVEACRQLLGEVRAQIRLPGLIFIDTPGHTCRKAARRSDERGRRRSSPSNVLHL